MAFGAKTVAVLVKEVSENASMPALEVGGNASIKMKSAEALAKLADPLKKHKSIKKVILSECEITDDGCSTLAEILKENHVIEELNLEKNKIGAEGAKKLADALAGNKGLRTLNLMQQTTKNFGEDTLEHFITMFNDNITLTKIMWRLESRKSFMLNKLQTRNVEIKKRQDKGEDFSSFLPDHLKPGAAGESTAAPAAAEPEATPAPAAASEPSSPEGAISRKRSSVKEMEEHVAAVEAAVGELKVEDEPQEEEAPEEEKPAEAPEEEKPAEATEEEKPAEATEEKPAEGYTADEPPKAAENPEDA